MKSAIEKIEIVRVSSKGQLVIPQDLREKMHIQEGSMFAIASVDQTLVLKKIEKPLSDEDLKTIKRVEEAWEDIEHGRCRTLKVEDFLKELKTW